MHTQAIQTGWPAISWGWIRNPRFDLAFVLGVATVALASGAAIVAEPALFPVILVLDLWLLGYHHVVSTYTRLAFDFESFRANRFLVVGLPGLVLAASVALAWSFGAWTLATIYLYWQWFHYTRQSYGIAQIYRRKSGDAASSADAWLHKSVIYLVPLWGILNRSAQAPEKFLGFDIVVVPVPDSLVALAAVAAFGATAGWLWRQLAAWREGRFFGAYALYMISHIAIFVTGYVLIDDINYGWLVINIWHNAQYILLVWMFNNNRFRAGPHPEHRFLSWLSQSRNALAYFSVCFLISTSIYAAIQGGLSIFGVTALSAVLVIYQTINFHHYIVDALIWKVRKPKIQANFGLARAP